MVLEQAVKRSGLDVWRWKLSFLMGVCVLLSGCHAPGASAKPTIEFSKVPQAEEGGPDKVDTVEGRVTNARAGQQIVLFAKSGVWWVQPLANQPFTTIQSDSSWKSSTHFGTEYAALLVEPGYSPPITTDVLPTEGGSVIAVATTKGKEAPRDASKLLHFSGYEWEVRRSASERGGSTNAFNPANAWTDERGFLHLRITHNAGKWDCAEVKLSHSLGYGSYRFVVQDTSHLEPAVVFGMFTWDDAITDQNHREVDIEISRWGDDASKNAQYVIQPYYVPANVVRFIAPSGVLTHSFRWEPGKVSFRTIRGLATGTMGRAVSEQSFTSGIPSPGGESVHLNLYVYGNAKTTLQHGAEVVIEKFEFLP